MNRSTASWRESIRCSHFFLDPRDHLWTLGSFIAHKNVRVPLAGVVAISPKLSVVNCVFRYAISRTALIFELCPKKSRCEQTGLNLTSGSM